MKEQNLSMRALSLKAGLSEAFVKKTINTPSQNPRLDTVVKIALALNCDVGELAFGKSLKITDTSHLNKNLFERAVISVDELIEDNKIVMSSDQKAKAYLCWYELDLLDMSSDQKEKFNAVLRLIK